ncbi:hypothetical protein N9I30_02295 [Flavobacteriales bacterium]|nr:hypothetical protein [Flavobacteriales bacterium]
MFFFFFSCEKNNVQDTAIGCQVDGGVCLDDHSCCSGLDNINSSK